MRLLDEVAEINASSAPMQPLPRWLQWLQVKIDQFWEIRGIGVKKGKNPVSFRKISRFFPSFRGAEKKEKLQRLLEKRKRRGK